MNHAYQPRFLRAEYWLVFFAVISFPFLDWPWLPGNAYVRPLALYPIAFGLVLLVHHLGYRSIPNAGPGSPFRIFSLFAAVAVVITLVNILIVELAGTHLRVLGISFLDFSVRGIYSLLSGWAMYLFFVCYVSEVRVAVWASRIAIISGYVSAFFVFVQGASYFYGAEPARVLEEAVLRLFHYRGGQIGRAYGLAPESSLLADYLLVVVIPFSLAALTSGYSTFGRKRLPWIEIVVLALSLISLVLATSRIGLITLALLLVSALLIKPEGAPRWKSATRHARAALIVFVLLLPAMVLYSELLLRTILTAATPDAFTQEGGYVSNVTRLANILVGLEIFAYHPLFGVGLGGYPFYYSEYVPDWALWSPEVQSFLGAQTDVLIPEIALPTPKAMLPKLLSETGILGSFLFLWFFVSMLRRSLRAGTTERDPELRYLGFAAAYALIAIIPLSFNGDSFVMSHYYLIFAIAGLIGTAPERSVRRQA